MVSLELTSIQCDLKMPEFTPQSLPINWEKSKRHRSLRSNQDHASHFSSRKCMTQMSSKASHFVSTSSSSLIPNHNSLGHAMERELKMPDITSCHKKTDMEHSLLRRQRLEMLESIKSLPPTTKVHQTQLPRSQFHLSSILRCLKNHQASQAHSVKSLSMKARNSLLHCHS